MRDSGTQAEPKEGVTVTPRRQSVLGTIGHRYVEFFLGLAVLATAIWFLLGALSAVDGSGSGQSQYFARLDNAGGLTVGASVKVRGVSVGDVQGLEIDPERFDVIVTFGIDSDVRLPADTLLRVSSDSLLGGAVVILEIGTDSNILAAGDTLERTRSAVPVEQLIERFLFSQ